MAPIARPGELYAVSPQYRSIMSAPKDHYQFLNDSVSLSAPELYVQKSQKAGDLEQTILKLGGGTGTGWAGENSEDKPESLKLPVGNYNFSTAAYK